MSKKKLVELKQRKKLLLEKRQIEESELPHIYGKKHYAWGRKFKDSENRVNLLCAANQISKSSTAIRRCIENATDKERWKKFWGEGVTPTQFWYFYPDAGTLMREWLTKWMEWMPNGSKKSDPMYGWTVRMVRGAPVSITFNSGVTVFFQFYSRDLSHIQSSTVYEVFVDEELPEDMFDEIMFRLSATNGIFNAVFTPTLNQLFWKRAIETEDVLPNALKLTVSMYDCLTYEDGTPGAFSIEKINDIIAKCRNRTEIERRVMGRFVTEEGLTFYAFDFHRHFKKPLASYVNYNVYAAVDYGSGGINHPAAIVFIAVSPDMRSGRVYRCWRGDGQETTAGDVFEKYQELEKRVKLPIVLRTYDPASKDFGVIAARNGVSFIKAEKSRDAGQEIVNTLLRNDMLVVDDYDEESSKLVGEFQHLMNGGLARIRNKKNDDLLDALRYGCLLIPWDLSGIGEKHEEKPAPKQAFTEQDALAEQIRQRRGDYGPDEQDEWQDYAEEIEYWNEQFG